MLFNRDKLLDRLRAGTGGIRFRFLLCSATALACTWSNWWTAFWLSPGQEENATARLMERWAAALLGVSEGTVRTDTQVGIATHLADETIVVTAGGS